MLAVISAKASELRGSGWSFETNGHYLEATAQNNLWFRTDADAQWVLQVVNKGYAVLTFFNKSPNCLPSLMTLFDRWEN